MKIEVLNEFERTNGLGYVMTSLYNGNVWFHFSKDDVNYKTLYKICKWIKDPGIYIERVKPSLYVGTRKVESFVEFYDYLNDIVYNKNNLTRKEIIIKYK